METRGGGEWVWGHHGGGAARSVGVAEVLRARLDVAVASHPAMCSSVVLLEPRNIPRSAPPPKAWGSGQL